MVLYWKCKWVAAHLAASHGDKEVVIGMLVVTKKLLQLRYYSASVSSNSFSSKNAYIKIVKYRSVTLLTCVKYIVRK